MLRPATVATVDAAAITAIYNHYVVNTIITFDFIGILPNTVNFVNVPYQDMQVQNFQGGFVRPGGKWFRAPK